MTIPGAVVVDFPLCGEDWVAVNSPADHIPSHGTDMLGQRFAFDLLRVDSRPGINAHPAGTLRGIVLGGRTRECYAWGATVHAPFDGEVIRASDGMSERGWLHPVREIGLALWNAFTFRPSRLTRVLGNHVILRRDEVGAGDAGAGAGDAGAGVAVYAGFAHLAPGSVAVREGESVRRGAVIGRVGHTGNSTMPHLHFQLMDSADPLVANGVPCRFRVYEVRRAGGWARVVDGIPGRADRIRSVDDGSAPGCP